MASILGEVEALHRDHGYTGFMFYDDELNVSQTFVDLMNGLSDLQSRLGTEFRLRGFVKSELFTAEQAQAMHRAGFRWLLCGFEAANERILVNINKRAKLADNDRCVELAKRHGLKIKALMSIATRVNPKPPSRTPASGSSATPSTISTARSSPPILARRITTWRCHIHSYQANVWTYTHPKTGDRLHSHEVDYATCADYYKGDPNGGYRSFVFTDHLHAEDIVRLRDAVECNVRARLRIPFNHGAAALRYEHSMGQGLPDFIHRTRPTPTSATASTPPSVDNMGPFQSAAPTDERVIERQVGTLVRL